MLFALPTTALALPLLISAIPSQARSETITLPLVQRDLSIDVQAGPVDATLDVGGSCPPRLSLHLANFAWLERIKRTVSSRYSKPTVEQASALAHAQSQLEGGSSVSPALQNRRRSAPVSDGPGSGSHEAGQETAGRRHRKAAKRAELALKRGNGTAHSAQSASNSSFASAGEIRSGSVGLEDYVVSHEDMDVSMRQARKTHKGRLTNAGTPCSLTQFMAVVK